VSTKSIIVGSGPGELLLPVGVITDGQIVRRNGPSIEGIAASAITAGAASALVETSGPTTLTMGAVADNEVLTRSGTTIDGVATSAMTVGIATYANGVRETSGPTTLTMGAVADTEILTRSGTTVDGVLPSAMTVGVATYSNGVRETGGPTTLPMGAVAEGDYMRRVSAAVVGQTPTALAAAVASTNEAITPVSAATYSWDTTAKNLGVTYVTAQCDITLPDATQITNWVPGDPPRKLFKHNTTAFSVGLIAPANVAINGDTLGVDMTTIPGFNADPSATVLAPWCYVYRATAASFYVFGAQS